ncbi:MAG: hypothetical protein A2Y12_09650 [Planctomycetes bacterium GWF2_42_9]|nr:MAG: hypothetical protein A2Y12_09650 [Planctomycetes bacterium GWF2_42_9]
MKREKSAFTLVELLVVISIIALLLSILMPALNKVRDQGRAIVCSTNLKNLSNGYMIYMSNYKDYIAPMNTLNGQIICRSNFSQWVDEMGITGKSNAPQNFSYRQMILPLFFNKSPMSDTSSYFEMGEYANKKLTCPVTKGKKTVQANGSPHGYWITYGTNGDVDGWKITQIKSPGRTVLATDLSADNGTVCSGVWINSDEWTTDTFARIGRWHGEKTFTTNPYRTSDTKTAPNNRSFNGIFLDGHVERVKSEKEIIWRKDGLTGRPASSL